MEVEFRETGIYLPEIDLWLDNTDLAPPPGSRTATAITRAVVTAK